MQGMQGIVSDGLDSGLSLGLGSGVRTPLTSKLEAAALKYSVDVDIFEDISAGNYQTPKP